MIDYFIYKKNNKADELLSIWWFAVLAIIGAGIVIGVLIFFSSHVDIKEIESGILLDRVSNCINNLNIDENFVSGKSDIMASCKFNNDLFKQGSNYYIKILIDGNPIYELGNPSFDEECKIKEGALRAKYYPSCSQKEFYVTSEANKKILISILAASNVQGEALSSEI